MIVEVLEQPEREPQSENVETARTRIAASIACHAAIKINMPLDPARMEWLLAELAQDRASHQLPARPPHRLTIFMERHPARVPAHLVGPWLTLLRQLKRALFEPATVTNRACRAVASDRRDGPAAPLLTLDDAARWLDDIGLCLFLPRHTQLPAPAPSFVEACLGEPSITPPAASIDLATELASRLVAERRAVPLNLLGTFSEQPDFLITPDVLRWAAAVRGDRQWKSRARRPQRSYRPAHLGGPRPRRRKIRHRTPRESSAANSPKPPSSAPSSSCGPPSGPHPSTPRVNPRAGPC